MFFLLEEEPEAAHESQSKEGESEEAQNRTARRKFGTMHILLTVGRKLIANPNTHGTILGLIWASIQFRQVYNKHSIYSLLQNEILLIEIVNLLQVGSEIASNYR